MPENNFTEEQALKFSDLFIHKARNNHRTYDVDNRHRYAQYVSMVKKYNKDYFGSFDEYSLNENHPSLALVWMPRISRGFMTYPVIPRSIDTKTSIGMSTRIGLTIEPAHPNAKLESVADKFERGLSYFRDKIWNTDWDYQCEFFRQVGRAAFAHIYADKSDGVDIDIENLEHQPIVTGDPSLSCAACGASVSPEDVGLPNYVSQVQQQADTLHQQFKAGIPPPPATKTSKQDKQEEAEQLFRQDGSAALRSTDAADADDQEPEGAPESAYPAQTPPQHLQDYHQALSDLQGQPEVDTSQMSCPECGTGPQAGDPAAPEMPATSGPLEFANWDVSVDSVPMPNGEISKICTGTIKGDLYSALKIRFDEYPAVGFKIEKSNWFNYHCLMPAFEVESLCKDDEQKQKVKTQSPDSWTPPMRWDYALSMPNGNYARAAQSTINDKYQLLEVDYDWYPARACQNWTAPESEEIGDFKIKAGQTIAEAFGGPDQFKGLCVMTCNEEVIKVWNEPYIDKKWVGIGWRIDPHTAMPSGEEHLLHLQDAVTRVFTLVYAHSQRAAAPKMVIDGKYLNIADAKANITGGIIQANQDMEDTSDVDLTKKVFMLEAGELSQTVQQFIELILEIVKEETQVFDSTVGNEDPTNRTASGRQLAANNNLRMHTSTTKSKGEALIKFAYIVCELMQGMNDEFFKLFEDQDEDEWGAVDLDAIRSCDIRKELKIAVVDGSDIPRTREDMEEGFLAALQLGLFDPQSPMPLDVRETILKTRGINYDLEEGEANRRIADTMYQRIKDEIEAFGEDQVIIMAPPPPDPSTGQPIMGVSSADGAVQSDTPPEQPAPIMIPQCNPTLIQELFSNPLTQPQDFLHNAFVFIKFFKEKLYGLYAQKHPNVPLMMVLLQYLSAYRGIVASQLAAAAMAQQGAATPPGQPGDQSSGPGEPPQSV